MLFGYQAADDVTTPWDHMDPKLQKHAGARAMPS